MLATLSLNNKEIFSGPLKLRGNGPFQIVFTERAISCYYIIET
jgi:hypothetical protein